MWLTRRDLFDPFFDDLWADDEEKAIQSFSPAANVIEKKDKYELEIFLPGMKKEDINIEAKNGMLTVSGERKREENKEAKEGYSHYETVFGKFSRSWNIEGVNPDNVKADYRDGVLKVSLPKQEESKPKKIELK